MLKLGNLVPAEDKVAAKRKGRGPGSGNGKTGGRGHKGQGQRSGGGVRPGFEGGQMPLQRRQPKRGFNNYRFATVYATINISDLKSFEKDAVVDTAALQNIGLVKKTFDGVKLLGNGEINVPLTVKVSACSKSAKEKIEAAGGKIEVI